MRSTIVFTLTGSDRVGIVEEVTGVLLGLGGNIETSRMARLGGEFAMLVLLSLPAEKVGELDGALAYLTEHGYKVTTIADRRGAHRTRSPGGRRTTWRSTAPTTKASSTTSRPGSRSAASASSRWRRGRRVRR